MGNSREDEDSFIADLRNWMRAAACMVGSYRVALRQVNENEFKHVGRLDLQESDWRQLVDVKTHTAITVTALDSLMRTLIRGDRYNDVRMRARD